MQDMFGDTFKTDNAIHSQKIMTLGKKAKQTNKKTVQFFLIPSTEVFAN